MKSRLVIQVQTDAGWSRPPAEHDSQTEPYASWLANHAWRFMAVGVPETMPQIEFLNSQGHELEQDASLGWRVFATPEELAMRSVWREIPPVVAIILDRRGEQRPMVVRRCAFERVGGFRNVGDAAWDWRIRAALAREKFDVAPLATRPGMQTSAVTAAESWPLLVPAVPGPDRNWLKLHLQDFDTLSRRLDLVPGVDAQALRAGLLQWHDFLAESHQIAQELEGVGEQVPADYWHAIMHRREPDYGNAKYWFRRVGHQATFPDLAREAATLLRACDCADAGVWHGRLCASKRWDPLAFVDFCQSAAIAGGQLRPCAEQIQATEMLLLLGQNIRNAQPA